MNRSYKLQMADYLNTFIDYIIALLQTFIIGGSIMLNILCFFKLKVSAISKIFYYYFITFSGENLIINENLRGKSSKRN